MFNTQQKKEIILRLKTYQKFLVVRHPVERLLSAYKNKFVSATPDGYAFQRAYAYHMMTFARNTSLVPPSGAGMTFKEFLSFLVSHNPAYFQEHWAPYFHLCHPCTISYDFIGVYETLEDDSNQILRKINAPIELKFPTFIPSNTSKDLKQVWKAIPLRLQEAIFHTYFPDYTLFGYKKDPT